ncbi:MAG TPA: PHP domain-containing protein, partial [Acidimicrobiales bacterium]|nr:PHP domain-containing protein [Acidimicrobiales bacterium]
MSRIHLDEDYHVHSRYSDDGQSTLEANLLAAEHAGLRAICLVDHVHEDTTWVPDLIDAVHHLRRAQLRVLVGVETEILDRGGRLDLPDSVAGVDYVLLADHQFPSDAGPVSAYSVRAMLARGELDAEGVVECLVDAIVGAMARVEHPIVAHPFSLLPRVGLDESHVSDSLVDYLARGARRHGAFVELNEKWNCPGPRLVTALARSGVQLVAGSDSHHCSTIGVFDRVRANLEDSVRADMLQPAAAQLA